MDPTSLLTLPDWRHAYRDGASPRLLLDALRQRLATTSPPEAWITLVDAASLASAVEALEARAALHPERAAALAAMPLFGVPFAVKDNIDVAGFPTTGACPAFERDVTADAHAVAKLIAAGAVCMGKTNLDQFATGLVGARSPYGRPSSTFAPERVSGGSSSGSAVVVARGDVAFALGTDTAGSGRVPAGFNNLVGLKPTPGRIGTTGVLPACRSLDCISVLALTVADAAEVLRVMEGPDDADAYSAFRLGAAALAPSLRVGVPAVPIFGSVDIGYAAAFDRALANLRALGHTVVPLDFAPLLAVAKLLYGGPWVAERHAVVQDLMHRDPAAIDPTVLKVIEIAHDFSATDAFLAQYTLRDAQRETARLWQQVDLLMVPTAPHHPLHADIDADPLGANALLGTYTNFVNLLGWCALALPASFTTKGLPFGVTFIAPGAADAALARFGRTWEASVALPIGATGRAYSAAWPADAAPWPASEATMPIAVVGAHLSGLPLNAQLTERGATLRETTTTTPAYRLFALPNTTPPKPGLQRVSEGEAGASIAVEVWDVPVAAVGSFLALIPPPLGLGSLELADGRWAHGFVCEGHATAGARDVTSFGGWRAYLQAAKTGAA